MEVKNEVDSDGGRDVGRDGGDDGEGGEYEQGRPPPTSIHQNSRSSEQESLIFHVRKKVNYPMHKH